MVRKVVDEPFDGFDPYPVGVIECPPIDVELSQPGGDDREQITRARQAAEALFRSKPPVSGPSVPASAPADQSVARLRAYRDEAGVDWVQFESPHSIDKIKAARAAVTGPFSFMKGKFGRYLDLEEHLALGVTIAWYPGFTHRVT
jgi:2-methylisocitrate lyase-like PEP mutase family enzyme